MNRLIDIDGVYTHLNRQSNLTNHIVGMRADDATADDAAVAVYLWVVIKQQLGKALQMIN